MSMRGEQTLNAKCSIFNDQQERPKAPRFREAFDKVQTCKPGSVHSSDTHSRYPPFLWDCDHSQPLATYPLFRLASSTNSRLSEEKTTYLVFQHLWFAPHNITAARVSSYLTISPLLFAEAT